MGIADLGSRSGCVTQARRAVQGDVAIAQLEMEDHWLIQEKKRFHIFNLTHIAVIASNARISLLALALSVQGIANIAQRSFHVALAELAACHWIPPVAHLATLTPPAFRVATGKGKDWEILKFIMDLDIYTFSRMDPN